ncbi:MAG: response regulator, partial [bacterium]|nr:response regulator [bacterium]
KVNNISGVTNLASGELCLILNMQDILHHDFNQSVSTTNQKFLTNDVLSYKKILVIDDSMTTRTMIKNILMNIGYNVDTSSDVPEAFVKLKLNHFDLIITDLNMPDINGYQFIEKIKNDESYQDIPIWVMSSESKDKALRKLKQYNIEGFISKEAFNQTEFLAKIKETIEKYHI